MNRITKLIEETEPSISADEFFSTVVTSPERMQQLFVKTRVSLLIDVLALDEVKPHAYESQLRASRNLQSLGLHAEGMEVLQHVKENIERNNPHFITWIENEIRLYDKEVSDMLKDIFTERDQHLSVFPKGTRAFIEGHTPTDEGITACFCRYEDRDNAEWITGLIPSLNLLEHAAEMEANAVHDSVDHCGSHVQKEASKREAAVVLNEEFDRVLKDYLESGKYFKVVRA